MDEEELQQIIKQGEGYNLEFKERFSDEVIESLVAFANNKGGRVVSQTATIKIFPDKIIFLNYGGLPQEYKVEDFILGKRGSYIRNKLITRIFKDVGIIEEYSSGLARVVNSCKENSNRKPVFNVDRTSFRVEIESLNKDNVEKTMEKSSKKSSEKSGQLGGQKSGQILTERQDEILKLIKKNPLISREELSNNLNINPSAVQKHIEKLKQKGIIKRVGPDKGGYWEIIER